jgi:hypothetical protein
MGYYPTPETLTPVIATYLKRQREGLIRILDPCAGDGTALKIIGTRLKAKTYGVEIDLERGRRANKVLSRCLVTDYQNTRISHGAFSLLYLNPPYDWAARDDELQTSERYERIFLRDCIRYLCVKGVVVYLIPQTRLDGHVARMLTYRFEEIGVFRFPEQEYRTFRQLVIFGVLKKRPGNDDEATEYLKNCGARKAVVPHLPERPAHVYELPVSPAKTTFVFRSKEVDPEELSEEILRHGLFSRLKAMTTPLRLGEKIRPIMPLCHGHLAQVLACRMMNGVVWDKHRRNPLLVKGVTKKEVRCSVEKQGDVEKHIETDEIKIVIRAFNSLGELLTIQ